VYISVLGDDAQATQHEDTRDCNLFLRGQIQAAYHTQWQNKDCDIENNVNDCMGSERCGKVDHVECRRGILLRALRPESVDSLG
jgi:hypothetical protein